MKRKCGRTWPERQYVDQEVNVSESKGKQRRFSTEEKRAILAEAEQPGVTITGVCRKHRIAATQFYRWRALAEQGATQALKAEGRGRAKSNGDSEAVRLQAELDRLRAVVSEITAENLELKKRI
jgi:transposase-like protein